MVGDGIEEFGQTRVQASHGVSDVRRGAQHSQVCRRVVVQTPELGDEAVKCRVIVDADKCLGIEVVLGRIRTPVDRHSGGGQRLEQLLGDVARHGRIFEREIKFVAADKGDFVCHPPSDIIAKSAAVGQRSVSLDDIDNFEPMRMTIRRIAHHQRAKTAIQCLNV